MAEIIDSVWLLARIEKTKALIVKYEDAIDALDAGVTQYSLDTGQTRQSVTRRSLSELHSKLAALENRLATLEARLCGGGAYGRPGF